MRKRIIFISAILVSVALAQNPGEVKRMPTTIPPLLQQYDFGAQVKELQSPDGAPARSVKPQFGPPSITTAPPRLPVQRDSPPKDVTLPQSAQEAVNVSERWRGDGTPPAVGPDGRVLYSYGAGLPTVVCTPLRVCIIELQAGEKVVGEHHIGDSVRWNIAPAMYGTGDQATSIIVLKPQNADLDTNLLITTDRRAYYLRLVSKPEEYVARIAFAYAADDSAPKWQQQLAAQHAQEKLELRSAETPPAILAADKLNFDYRIKGGDDNIRPRRVFDDGAKTYIQMPAEVQHREAPVLLIIGTDGKGEMTNYRVKDQTYIVDRLFDHANWCWGRARRPRKWRSAVRPKDTQPPVQPIDSPSGLDLHPRPQRTVRISRRAGGAVICVIASVLLAFAYGGYRRSVKDEAAARRAGLPTTVAPATQAGTEFVSAVPLGNATLAKAAELQPPPDSKGVAGAACGTDPRTGTQYRYNPQTGQPCEGIQQERVVVRQTPRQGPPKQLEQPREPTPQEQAAALAYRREQEAILAPTGTTGSMSLGSPPSAVRLPTPAFRRYRTSASSWRAARPLNLPPPPAMITHSKTCRSARRHS